MNAIEQDLHERWRPTAEQIDVAKAMLSAVGSDYRYVCVPLALVNKRNGFWTEDVEVEAGQGFFLDSNRNVSGEDRPSFLAEDAAWRKLGDRPGTDSYARIRRDGTWVVFEGIRQN